MYSVESAFLLNYERVKGFILKWKFSFGYYFCCKLQAASCKKLLYVLRSTLSTLNLLRGADDIAMLRDHPEVKIWIVFSLVGK